MPEMLEVEAYRLAADPVVGRTIERVHAPDEWFIKGATSTESLHAELPGRRVLGTRRIGKLMLIDTDGGVKDLQVLEAQPPGVFEDAALAALRNWTFRPAQYEWRSVAIRVLQTYRFSWE